MNAVCNRPASKNILIKTKHQATPFTPYKLTNLVRFAQKAFSYKTPLQYIQGLRSCFGSGPQSENQEGVSHLTAQSCPGQQRDEVQERARTARGHQARSCWKELPSSGHAWSLPRSCTASHPGKWRQKPHFGLSEHMTDSAGAELHEVTGGKKVMVQPCSSLRWNCRTWQGFSDTSTQPSTAHSSHTAAARAGGTEKAKEKHPVEE